MSVCKRSLLFGVLGLVGSGNIFISRLVLWGQWAEEGVYENCVEGSGQLSNDSKVGGNVYPGAVHSMRRPLFDDIDEVYVQTVERTQ